MKYLFSQIHEEQSLTADNKQKKLWGMKKQHHFPVNWREQKNRIDLETIRLFAFWEALWTFLYEDTCITIDHKKYRNH